jgi:hypothetical protein
MIDTTSKDIIDKYLNGMIEKGLNSLPIRKIHPEMADNSQDPSKEWKTWLPIESKVEDAEIDELEKYIGYKLPVSYRDFLKYKHFYELLIDESSFCQHDPNSWRSSLTNLIFESYPREFLIDKGYIPFAVWSDWGLLCFDTTKNSDGNNYSIVQWDHERYDQFSFFSQDFRQLLTDLDNMAIKNGI